MLLEIWKKEHKFLNADSSTHIMSKEIGLPVHHVTYFFNQISNEKYIYWRNRLRVEYAIDLINRQEEYNKTIEVLSKECGFKSYSAFFKVLNRLQENCQKIISEISNHNPFLLRRCTHRLFRERFSCKIYLLSSGFESRIIRISGFHGSQIPPKYPLVPGGRIYLIYPFHA